MISPTSVTRQHALVLDFDGTMVEIAATPDGVAIPETLSPMLIELHRVLDSAIAIVTGRSVATIEEFLQLPDAFVIVGVHGAEWRGREASIGCDLAAALDRLQDAVAARFPDLLLERKSAALAVHYRDCPQRAVEIASFLDAYVQTTVDLKHMAGKAVSEIKPVWANKGAAVERLLATPAFEARTPIMLGDDVTDEDGFRVAQQHNGIAIKVGDGESVARCRLPTPGDVRRWLTEVACHLRKIS